VSRRDRDILELAIHAVAEQADKVNAIIDEAYGAGLAGSHPVTLKAKMRRLELLNVKADPENENLAGSFFTARPAVVRPTGLRVGCHAGPLGSSRTRAAWTTSDPGVAGFNT